MTVENRGWPELLGDATIVKREILAHKGDMIEVVELPELRRMAMEVFRPDNTTYGGETLSIDSALLNKLRDGSGSIARTAAVSAINEIGSYLQKRGEDVYSFLPESAPISTGGAFGQGAFGEFAFGGGPNGPTGPVNSEPLNNSTLNSGPHGPIGGGPIGTSGIDPIAPAATTLSPSPLTVSFGSAGTAEMGDTLLAYGSGDGRPAIVQTNDSANGRITTITVRSETWINVPKTRQVKEDIKKISELLEEVLSQVHGSNLTETDHLVTDLDKAQLIAILQTAIAVLKAPMIPKGFLTKLSEALKEGTINAAKDKTQVAISAAMGAGGLALWNFITSHLMK